MIVRAKVSALKQGHWYEYLVRFGFGGLATVVAGLVAGTWGPAAGGLFLAFPAIFCASATLIEKHERERKENKGLKGKERGKDAAALALASVASHSPYLAQSCGCSRRTPPPAPSFLQRSRGSSWRSCFGACGAQCAFTTRETRTRFPLLPFVCRI